MLFVVFPTVILLATRSNAFFFQIFECFEIIQDFAKVHCTEQEKKKNRERYKISMTSLQPMTNHVHGCCHFFNVSNMYTIINNKSMFDVLASCCPLRSRALLQASGTACSKTNFKSVVDNMAFCPPLSGM